MTIEVTDEMVQLAVRKFMDAPGVTIREIDKAMREALAGVFAIVERDLANRPRECGASGPDGAWCERQPSHDELHGFVSDTGLVKW